MYCIVRILDQEIRVLSTFPRDSAALEAKSEAEASALLKPPETPLPSRPHLGILDLILRIVSLNKVGRGIEVDS